MEAQTKNCQNCKKDFTIEPEDFSFYEKIKVPPPTWCPECRFQRRFTWRNEGSFHKRKCDLCGKNIISINSPDNPFPVYCAECWWSDKWDPMIYSKEYDFSKSFFEQFKELMKSVPISNVWAFTNVESDYANYVAYSKNIYLSCSVIKCENIFYSRIMEHSNDCIDCYFTNSSESCYECLNTTKSHASSFLVDCRECINSHFLFDCVNCQNCFLSSNLRNKSFYIKNRQYSKEDYFKELDKYKIGSHDFLEGAYKEFQKLIKLSPHKFSHILKSINVSGDHITNSKNAHECFMVEGENVKYCWRVTGGIKDSYDISGGLGNELIYEASAAADNTYMTKFYSHSKNNRYSEFVYYCADSSYLFACIGLRNKQYCILNKQYTKEEYEVLVPKIIKHMNEMPYVDAKGRTYTYGEFFPPELSPFAYNETIAQEYFPLTKEEAEEKGYRWRDPDTKNYQITTKPEDLPDHIKDVPDSITSEVIGCSHAGTCNHQCTTAFKIIPQELQFYRQMNLPLPRLCPNCRHYERLKQRNPLKLWHRTCQCAGTHSQPTTNNKQQPDYQYQNTATHTHGTTPCLTKFETSYAPDRPEIVYCEQCYNAEVA